MRTAVQEVYVAKHIVGTNVPDYLPVSYTIEVDNHVINDMHESTIRFLYEQIGKLLNEKGGEQ